VKTGYPNRVIKKKEKKKKDQKATQNSNSVHFPHFLSNQTAKNKNSQPNSKRYKTSAQTNL
jgi:hypothetical protein